MGRLSRIFNVFRPRLEGELEDELRCHMEMRAEDQRRAGLDGGEARRAAERMFGNSLRIREEMRDMDVSEWLDSLWKDLRYAARQLRRSPGFTTVAVLSLALGIGANTGIFSLLDTVLLKDLAVRDPGALVILSDPESSGVAVGSSGGERGLFSYHEFEELNGRIPAFEGMFASESSLSRYDARVNNGPPEPVNARLVTGDFFDVLGTAPLLGRFFGTEADGAPGSAPYAVVSYDFWQRRFGGSPGVLGTSIRLWSGTVTVIGVAQRGFYGETVGKHPDAWVPMTMQPVIRAGSNRLREDLSKGPEKTMWLHVFGRLAPGSTLPQAQAQAGVLFKNILEKDYGTWLSPETRKQLLNQRLKLRPAAKGASTLRGQVGEPLRILLAVVGMVLLIACANIANLMMARASARGREMGVRTALGAGRGRLVRQMLIESLLIAFAGSLAGLIVAQGVIRLLIAVSPTAGLPGSLDAPFDLRVLAFTAGVAVVTALLFGLAPALRASRIDVNVALKEGSRTVGAPGARSVFARSLVAVQVGLSLVLLAGAGLFLKTLRNLRAVDLGYRAEQFFQVRVNPEAAGYPEQRMPQLYEDVREKLRRIPGVRGVTYSENGLFNGTESSDRVLVEGFTPRRKEDESARFDLVGPEYFSTLGIPILLGREIEARDAGRPVVVINQAFARTFFQGSNPLGRHVTAQFGDNKLTFEVIGVASDVRDHSLRNEIPPRYYRTISGGMYVTTEASFQIRAQPPVSAVSNAVRRAIQQVDPDLPVLNARPVVEFTDRGMARERTIAELSAVFGAVALLLASIGLYGVLSFGVARRTGEIGIRMALGAPARTVIRMVLAETGWMVAVGIAAGAAASAVLMRLVSSRLFGVSPLDPGTIAAAVAVLLAVSFGAALLPARRASKVNPITALRAE